MAVVSIAFFLLAIRHLKGMEAAEYLVENQNDFASPNLIRDVRQDAEKEGCL
jgi:hypothetical protein